MAREEERSPEYSAEGLLTTFAKSYADGEVRALAQEPVQNAKDARYSDNMVHVEYRLLRRMANDGNPIFHLTVTDRGTTGLSGETNPNRRDLKNASEEVLQELRWFHFERFFASNKSSQQSGSRGWGKSIFLHCSHFPSQERSAMMLYDTLLRNKEYRVGHFTILDDEMRVLKRPILNDAARKVVSAQIYVARNGKIELPLDLEPLSEPGTRIIVPYLSPTSIEALRDGSLASWLQYLWWRQISDGRLTITLVDEEAGGITQTIVEPEWCGLWASDATSPGEIHPLSQGSYVQILRDEQLGKGCAVKSLALLYDANLRKQTLPDNRPEYAGIQLFRAGQCIETYRDFDFIPSKEKAGIRAFVEFDEETDRLLRDKEKAQHDGFRRSGVVKNPILPYLREKLHEFADGIGLIKKRDTNDDKANEKFRRTSQFVFDKLLSKPMGDVLIENNGNAVGGDTERPWDVNVLFSYPNSKSTRVNWDQRITYIRFVVDSRPETLRLDTRFAIEWQAPDKPYEEIWSKNRPKADTEYALGYRVISQHVIDQQHIVCPEPGLYRIRAAVYEGNQLVAKSAKRIHVEMDPPERKESPFTVHPSWENETSPMERHRVESGDILRLQINGRNRTLEEVSGHLRLRTKEGQIILENIQFFMPAKPLGGDANRQNLHSLRLRVVRSETGQPGLPGVPYLDQNVLTLPLEPGRRDLQAYLMDGVSELARGSSILHFESEPSQSQGGMPFEPFQVLSGTPPMWELRMDESRLHFAHDYPLHIALLHNSTPESINGHSPFEMEINVNGLLQWALEPLLEDDADPTRLESLRDAKPNLVDDDAWEWYMDCLSELEAEMKNYKQGQPISPFDFALKWRKTVAAIYPVLLSEENA